LQWDTAGQRQLEDIEGVVMLDLEILQKRCQHLAVIVVVDAGNSTSLEFAEVYLKQVGRYAFALHRECW